MDVQYQVAPGLPNYYLWLESVRLNGRRRSVYGHVITKFSRMIFLAIELRPRVWSSAINRGMKSSFDHYANGG